ncbi:MAG: hypothetical protein A3G34_05145 [Candidatus Lindowbacteria bacterium RIFCSPLOWO2_12_FULL_62_27]|nr:MAG: hypothetical protein A3I06_07460 [Candidatus Lindowbacteria bacterium RIFCSPLOWO2_02_FULL_62_12]OGH61373.1 MAG: hypothetical protein A3G34_05145 [Candidatus Lindowbacteria bacterium RIFCSPLOWO2_12_FULL_62_27]
MDGETKRILIIDDEEDLIDVLTARLAHLGYQAEGRTDPVEGRRAAIQTRPDLIILDVSIPGWSGLELIQSLVHLPHIQNVPVFIYTNLRDPELEPQAVKLGAAGFFIKAVDDPRMFQKIRELLD